MDPFGIVALVLGAGWVIGNLPGRNSDSDSKKKNQQVSAPSVRNVNRKSHERPSYKVEVLPEYELARDLVLQNFPVVFVTGGAGTGKSTFIRWLSDQFEGHVLVGAPTGVASINVDGKTLHSLCMLPPAWILESDIKEFKPSIARGAKLLIIDEISMVNANLLDGVSNFFKKNRGVNKPFGGLPVVMVGDLFQLPPVITTNVRRLFTDTYKSSKFHGAHALKDCPYYAIELNKAFRQIDQQFVNLLGNLREGHEIVQVIEALNSSCVITDSPPDGAVWLSPRNEEVERRNLKKLAELQGPSCNYYGELIGKFKEDRLPSPMEIELRIGAQVMFTKNGLKWINGSLGTVVQLLADRVVVRLLEGDEEVQVPQEIWEQYDYKNDPVTNEINRVVIGQYTQIPLMLAWSITIHKSQGKTIERVHIDLGRGAFESGQTYVALSRCRSLERLTLSRPLTATDVKVDPEVQAFYAAIRSQIKQTPPEKIKEVLNRR